MTKEELSDFIKWSAEKVRQEQERERLTDLITSYFGVDPAYYGIEVAHLADYLIEKDVIIPVRCEDCKHWDNWGFGRGGCEREYAEDGVSSPWLDNDFCSYGERKDNDR